MPAASRSPATARCSKRASDRPAAAEPAPLSLGYGLAAVLMSGAAVVARVLGVNAERRSLESLRDD
jgi:hypothetical protein